MTANLLLGALVSFINFGIHAMMTGLIVVATRRTASVTDHLGVFGRLSALLTITVTVLMVAHVVEVGVWATYYRLADVIPKATVNTFEFAFENYTALGYGEPVPEPGHRLTGPITALNGLLLIGWSVAIIFEVMRMAEVQIGHKAGAQGRRGKTK
ncbi:MAG: Ion transport 2 protein [Xanthobacteraceae bacterium]|nr:Ion transport 2 protein [Xanthobacteraceae bacterium]